MKINIRVVTTFKTPIFTCCTVHIHEPTNFKVFIIFQRTCSYLLVLMKKKIPLKYIHTGSILIIEEKKIPFEY